VKHQVDIQAHKEQTNEPNLFCSERYEAPVCCTRNVKHFLPRSMNGAKVKGFGICFHSCRLLPARQSEGYYLMEKSQHTGWTLAFVWTDCDKYETHARNISVRRKFFMSQHLIIRSD